MIGSTCKNGLIAMIGRDTSSTFPSFGALGVWRLWRKTLNAILNRVVQDSVFFRSSVRDTTTTTTAVEGFLTAVISGSLFAIL